MAWSTTLEILSSILSIVCLLYLVGMWLYLIDLIFRKDIYDVQNENVRHYRLKIEVLLVLFKGEKLKHRFLPCLYVFRKIMVSLISTYLFSYPTLQAMALVANYFIYWVYVFVYNPIRDRLIRVFITFIEGIIMIMHILMLFIAIAGDDNAAAAEVELTYWMMWSIILLMYTYNAFAACFFIRSAYRIY